MDPVTIPAAIDRTLRLPQLQPEQFVPTKWDDTETKAKFGNHLLRFIAADFPETMFKQKFYQRLSTTFGMIAHYNRRQFFEEYFVTRQGRIGFLDDLTRHPCWGDPAFTYSDLERAVCSRIRISGIIDLHRRLLVQETARAERAEYDRLRRKFGDDAGDTPAQAVNPDTAVSSVASTVSGARAPVSVAVRQSRQADLFAFLE